MRGVWLGASRGQGVSRRRCEGRLADRLPLPLPGLRGTTRLLRLRLNPGARRLTDRDPDRLRLDGPSHRPRTWPRLEGRRGPLSTSPPGSASAITRASRADPCRALARSDAALLASGSGTRSTTSHVLRKRFTLASVRGLPVRDSTRTIDGTTGGQRPSFLNARITARVSAFRRASLLTPPELPTGAVADAPRRRCGLLLGGFRQ